MKRLLFLMILLLTGLPVNAKTKIVVHEDISGYGELSTKSCSIMKVLEFDDKDVDKAFKEISKIDPTAYIDKKVYKQTTCKYSAGEYLGVENASRLNNFGKKKVKVAIIDSGLNPKHRLFKNRKIISDGKKDDTGHGTGVAGVIADCTPNNVILMPIKIFDKAGYATHSDIIFAIEYAINHGADVINLSLGGPDMTSDEEEILRRAYKKNILVFASAGNSSNSNVCYPGRSIYTIAVGSVDINPKVKKSWFSSYGKEVDFVAPGDSIETVDHRGHRVFMSGTSLSTPHLSALGCYLKLVKKNMTVKEAYKYLKSSCDDYGNKGKDTYYGWGMPQINKAVNKAYRKQLKSLKFKNGKLKVPVNFYIRYGKYAKIYRKKDKKLFVKRRIK